MGMTTTERSAAIRAALKAKGISSRQVSIKTSYFAGGSSIDIRVKDPNVSTKEVEAIAEEHESIRRCEITGEILSGGNRYLHVQYSHEALIVLRDRYLDVVKAAAANVSTMEPNRLYPVEGTGYLLGGSVNNFSLWNDSRMCAQYLDVNGAAERIGVLKASR